MRSATFRDLKPGEGGIAKIKWLELARHGVSVTMMMCRLLDGLRHTFLLAEAGVLDNRLDEIANYGDIGCQER